MTAVDGSGIKIMSDSLIPFQPAMEEPSNILPSLKNPSSTRRVGTVTYCSLPMVSVKRRSQNFASFSLINFRTSAGVIFVLALCSSYSGPVMPGSVTMQQMCQYRSHTESSTCDQEVCIAAPLWRMAPFDEPLFGARAPTRYAV